MVNLGMEVPKSTRALGLGPHNYVDMGISAPVMGIANSVTTGCVL